MWILLLAALFALLNVPPGRAQTGPKPSKPLDLLANAKVGRAAGAGPSFKLNRGSTASRATDSALRPAPLSSESAIAPSAGTSVGLVAGNAITTGAVRAPGPERTTTLSTKPAPPAAAATEGDTALFCGNVADAAVDARLAWQMAELEKAESALRQRIAELEARRADYEKWLTLRDEFLKKAEAGVVEIYSRMRPEAAATQIASMTDETAAAVLAKLSPRNSSAIFNEMDSARAAHLADLLGGMRRVEDGKTSR
jgi:flagellar motility protein MotE (MotC chaperone)